MAGPVEREKPGWRFWPSAALDRGGEFATTGDPGRVEALEWQVWRERHQQRSVFWPDDKTGQRQMAHGVHNFLTKKSRDVRKDLQRYC